MTPQNGSKRQDGTRVRAYRAGASMARERMAREAPADAALLERVEASDIVVVPGSYDHVELVLDALAMPYLSVGAAQLAGVRLRPEQLLVVNCPGTGLGRALPAVERFIRAGGSLFTTDWALRHVLEPLFPGTVRFNQRPTADDVVRIEVRRHDNPFLSGVMDGRDDPQWWLEASSYPIQVVDPARVEVMIASSELGAKYGEPAVAVLFHHGEGEVFHMISHYFLQRTELRGMRHQQPATAYFTEKDVPVAPGVGAMAQGLSLGDIESAASSARLLANVVAAKKRRAAREATR